MTIKDNVARRTVSTFLLFLLASGTASSQGFQGSDTNYSNCVAGFSFGCRLDVLTDAQRRGIKSKWESQAQDAVSQVTVPCAENGSCYGDISVATSRPKTVHVKGYYRRDGTYVRGHYRSKPRR